MVNGIRAYADSARNVDSDDRPKILIKILQGLLDKLAVVRVAIERKQYEVKYTELSKITTIIEVLRGSLDMSKGEIPRNLDMLYSYLIKLLSQVHTTLDTGTIDECRHIVETLLEGFLSAYEKESKLKRQNTQEKSATV